MLCFDISLLSLPRSVAHLLYRPGRAQELSPETISYLPSPRLCSGHPEMVRRPGVHKDTGENIDTGKYVFVR